MSRSGYNDDWCDDGYPLSLYRQAVASAIGGKRGQAFLKEMLAALDAMPVKRLIADELEASGEVCALGAVGIARGTYMADIEPEDNDAIAARFSIARAMASEIMWLNDEAGPHKQTPEERWERMRAWVVKQIKADPSPDGGSAI